MMATWKQVAFLLGVGRGFSFYFQLKHALFHDGIVYPKTTLEQLGRLSQIEYAKARS